MENIDHYGLPTLIKPRKGIDDPQLMVSSAAKQVDLFIFRIQTSALWVDSKTNKIPIATITWPAKSSLSNLHRGCH